VILWNEQAVLPETQSFVKEFVCTGCGQCVQVCPYNAISLHPQKGIAVVDEFLCQGCGTCAGTCRVQAIDIKSYGDIPLLEGLNAVLGPTQCMRAKLKEHEATDWEPTIMTFICSWCAAGAADLAGDSQFQYGHGVHFVKVPCVGRLNPLYIIKTLQKGADGVLIVGCHPRDCHFISGNLVQARTFEVIKKYMRYLGINADRVQFSWVSASEGAKFAGIVNKLVEDVKKLGPQKQMVKSI
jgi:heterodisulfide reductase subunit A